MSELNTICSSLGQKSVDEIRDSVVNLARLTAGLSVVVGLASRLSGSNRNADNHNSTHQYSGIKN